jgi:hypothetical protein
MATTLIPKRIPIVIPTDMMVSTLVLMAPARSWAETLFVVS